MMGHPIVGMSLVSDSARPLPPATPEQIRELREWYESRGIGPQFAAALAINHADKPLARLMGDTSQILARLMAGEKPKQVANSLGISREALNAWLLSHAPEEWRAISTGKSLARMEDAQELIESAEEQIDINRGRELGKLAGWHMERMLPKLYGVKGEGSSGVSINISVDPSCGGSVTIDQDN